MLTDELDYHLPPELIAQAPVEPRDASRLMVVDRATGRIDHRHFRDLPDWLQPGDLLVANDSRVIPARIRARKPSGGKVEILLLRRLDGTRWEALVGGHKVQSARIELPGGGALIAVVRGRAEDGAARVVEFSEPVEPHLLSIGALPIPPYIHAQPADPERYQTIYSRVAGSAAAPTAGLHFTPELARRLSGQGIAFAFVTLHIGLDTFKPIQEPEVEAHRIHTEWCELTEATAAAMVAARERGRRVIAVGTTSARALETAAQASAPDAVRAYRGNTAIYITPGYRFRAVDTLVTNFHLPRSTLLAMISAFMGLGLARQAYDEAIRQRYRFYSFGDAMLIV